MKFMNEIYSYLSPVIAYTRYCKVKDKFGCGDLGNWDTFTKIIRSLGIPKVDLDTKYD